MSLLENLKEQGWYLTEEGLKKLTTINNLQTEDVNKIISLALNWDLKDIAGGALPSKPDSNGTIPGRIILQIQKMRNISAPKANEESTAAPRFLQLELTDGVNTIAALEFERISNLNLNVPPGTKLFIKSEKVKLFNGFVVLKSSDIQIVGGKVEPLIEKWELARQMLKYAKSSRLSGSNEPPPWIAFGKRLDGRTNALTTEKNFKSLQIANEKDKGSKENDEFNASRTQAIAEAAKAGQKKVFGGGQQNILDHNVKKILEKNYSEEEAKLALKSTNNNLERALYNLKRRNNIRTGPLENTMKPASNSTSRMRDKGGIGLAKEEASVAKPQTNVSLFDFLTDKLPANISSSNNAQNEPIIKTNDHNARGANSVKNCSTKNANIACNRFENNMSSSFAANRATAPTTHEDNQSSQSRCNTVKRRQEESHQQTGNKNGKQGERSNSNRSKTLSSNFSKTQNQVTTTEDKVNLTGNNLKRNEKSFKKERQQPHKYSISDYQYNKGSTEYNKSIEKKSYQSKDFNRNQDSKSDTNSYQQKQPHKANIENDLDDLIDNTSKLTIKNKKDLSLEQNRDRNQHISSDNNQHISTGQLQRSEHYSKTSQRQSSKFKDPHNFSPKSQLNSKLETHVSQVGNGFAYDPSKIVGFQSKEANEYAMNMLKSQGMAMQQLQQLKPTTQTQQTSSITSQPTEHPKNAIVNSQMPSSVTYVAHNHNVFVAPPQQSSPQFGMISGENWPWKVGDLCLAKYWDDGNYYNTKITAISDKTCVVLFLGYGNYEEVLKSDCIPITDARHIPLNSYQGNTTTPSMSQQPLPMVQQRSNVHSNISSVGNHRYRGERQMYIPPPKRNNN